MFNENVRPIFRKPGGGDKRFQVNFAFRHGILSCLVDPINFRFFFPANPRFFEKTVDLVGRGRLNARYRGPVCLERGGGFRRHVTWLDFRFFSCF